MTRKLAVLAITLTLLMIPLAGCGVAQPAPTLIQPTATSGPATMGVPSLTATSVPRSSPTPGQVRPSRFAARLLAAAYDALTQAKTYHFDMDMETIVDSDQAGGATILPFAFSGDFQQPGRLQGIVAGGSGPYLTYVYRVIMLDGTTYVTDPTAGQWQPFDQAQVNQEPIVLGLAILGAQPDLLEEVALVGQETLGDTLCHHLRARLPAEVELWLDVWSGVEDSRIRKAVLATGIRQFTGPEIGTVQTTATMTFSNFGQDIAFGSPEPNPPLALFPPASLPATPVPPVLEALDRLPSGWTSFSTGNDVVDMDLGPDGQLWVASTGGAVRWDPAAGTYVKYTRADGLASNRLSAIAAATEQEAWAATQHGASRLDGDAWVTYTQADGLASDIVQSIAIDHSGTLWFGTSSGLCRLDGQVFETLTEEDGLASRSVKAIAVSSVSTGEGTGETMWLLHDLGGLSRFDGQHWSSPGSSGVVPGIAVNAIAIAPALPDGQNDTVWIGTGYEQSIGGAFCLDGETWTPYTTADGLAADQVLAIAAEPSPDGGVGALWFGTPAGASRFDGRNWTTVTPQDGLVAADVRSIVADPAAANDGGSATLWFGTSHGVSRWDGAMWSTYVTADPLPGNTVTSLAVAPDGALWLGTDHGVARFDGETWTSYTAAVGLADDYVTAIAVAPDGALWFGTAGGASRFDDRAYTWTTYTIANGLLSDYVTSIAAASDGAVWVGTPGGASRFDGQTWTRYSQVDGLDSHLVQAIAAAPDGALWFGVVGGAIRFDGQAWTRYPAGESLGSGCRASMGMSPDSVASVAVAPDGALWFGMAGCMSRFDGQAWTTYTQADGLVGGLIASISFAPDGTMWIGTSGGRYLRRGTGAMHFDGQAWTPYTVADGLVEDTVLSVLVVPDGSVWFGTNAGVSRYASAD